MPASDRSFDTLATPTRQRAHHSEAVRYFGFLFAALALMLALFFGFSLYEWGVLGETQLGMRKAPAYAPYYIGRFATEILLSLLLAAGLYMLRASGSGIDKKRMPSSKRRIAWFLLMLAAVSAGLFAVDARLYNRLSLEDHALEWVSALLPLAASAAFAVAFIRVARAPQRDVRRRVALVLCASFAVTLFVVGMEEISWLQRVFEITTPAMFAENQQHEMNLHNMHSIVFGQSYKIAMFAGLVLLPFVAETAPHNKLFDVFQDFLPSRFIFAISAPWTAFNYNEWNFMASQLFVTLALTILGCYMKAAWERFDTRELALFGASALLILIVQPLFLALGARFVRMWDASEYVELFIAIGLTFYTAETIMRLAARYGDGETADR
jgi:hypothetical protein